LQRTPRSHQTRRLRVPSSDHRSLRLSSQNGCLFFRAVSSLDAFSSYPLRLDCPALLCTTGRSEATGERSFRTCPSFRSGNQHLQ